MINAKYLFPLALLLSLASLNADAALKKWVDKDGVTHYGDVVPPEYATTKKVEIRDGMEVQEKEKPKSKPNAKKGADRPAELTKEEIEQQRHDRALLGTYTNEQEIDAALNRSLQQVNARLNTYRTQMQSIQVDLDRLNKEKEASEKSNRPVDKRVQSDIDQLTARMQRLKAGEAKAQSDADTIKARYAADKQRFRELTSKEE